MTSGCDSKASEKKIPVSSLIWLIDIDIVYRVRGQTHYVVQDFLSW